MVWKGECREEGVRDRDVELQVPGRRGQCLQVARRLSCPCPPGSEAHEKSRKEEGERNNEDGAEMKK